jgi:hypothetical protein
MVTAVVRSFEVDEKTARKDVTDFLLRLESLLLNHEAL